MKEKRFAEHFCQLTDEVIVPLFKNLGNMEMFPRCLVNDIKQQVKHLSPIKVISTREVFSLRLPLKVFSQVQELSTTVYQIRGHIKGKTLLPLPRNATQIEEEEKRVYLVLLCFDHGPKWFQVHLWIIHNRNGHEN